MGSALLLFTYQLVSAVAVVREGGSIAGVVSVKDIRDRLQNEVKFMELNAAIGTSEEFM
jgi:CBS domain-containing protein